MEDTHETVWTCTKRGWMISINQSASASDYDATIAGCLQHGYARVRFMSVEPYWMLVDCLENCQKHIKEFGAPEDLEAIPTFPECQAQCVGRSPSFDIWSFRCLKDGAFSQALGLYDPGDMQAPVLYAEDDEINDFVLDLQQGRKALADHAASKERLAAGAMKE